MCFIVSMKVSRNQISSANIYQIQSGQNTNHGGTLQSSAMTAIIYMNANCQKKKEIGESSASAENKFEKHRIRFCK